LSHWELSTRDWQSRRWRRDVAHQEGSTTPTVAGSGVLKEEPVQFPVTFHTPAAYFVTKIKLYSTFSIYFRVKLDIYLSYRKNLELATILKSID